MPEFECALTGKIVETEQNEDFPTGWTKITITRRQVNPKYAMLMQVQSALIEGAMMQVPEEMAPLQRVVITSQVEAQFHALMRDTPSYVTDVEDEVYICDSSEVNDSMTELRELLGLKALPAIPQADEDEDEQEEETTGDKAEE